jgi:hypothetical protein
MKMQSLNSLVNGTHHFIGVEPENTHHQFHITVRDINGDRAVPTVGTLVITSRSPGALEYEDMGELKSASPFTIYFYEPSSWIGVVDEKLHSTSFKMVITDLPADHTVDIHLSSS